MPRNANTDMTTTEAGRASTIRQKGFAITVKCFIPASDDIDGQIAVLNTLKELGSGDLSSLREVAAADSIEVTHKATSRKVAAT